MGRKLKKFALLTQKLNLFLPDYPGAPVVCSLRSVELAPRIFMAQGLSQSDRRPPEKRCRARYRALDITARRRLLMRVE